MLLAGLEKAEDRSLIRDLHRAASASGVHRSLRAGPQDGAWRTRQSTLRNRQPRDRTLRACRDRDRSDTNPASANRHGRASWRRSVVSLPTAPAACRYRGAALRRQRHDPRACRAAPCGLPRVRGAGPRNAAARRVLPRPGSACRIPQPARGARAAAPLGIRRIAAQGGTRFRCRADRRVGQVRTGLQSTWKRLVGRYSMRGVSIGLLQYSHTP